MAFLAAKLAAVLLLLFVTCSASARQLPTSIAHEGAARAVGLQFLRITSGY